MEEADARVTLVDLSDTTAAGSLTLTLPRRHVEEALSMDEPIDLVLRRQPLGRRCRAGDGQDCGGVGAERARAAARPHRRRVDHDGFRRGRAAAAVGRRVRGARDARGNCGPRGRRRRRWSGQCRDGVSGRRDACGRCGDRARRSGRADRGSQVGRGDAVGDDCCVGHRGRTVGGAARCGYRCAGVGVGDRGRSSAEPLAADTGGLASASGIEAVRSRSRSLRIPVRWPRLPESRPFARRSRSLRRTRARWPRLRGSRLCVRRSRSLLTPVRSHRRPGSKLSARPSRSVRRRTPVRWPRRRRSRVFARPRPPRLARRRPLTVGSPSRCPARSRRPQCSAGSPC